MKSSKTVEYFCSAASCMLRLPTHHGDNPPCLSVTDPDGCLTMLNVEALPIGQLHRDTLIPVPFQGSVVQMAAFVTTSEAVTSSVPVLSS